MSNRYHEVPKAEAAQKGNVMLSTTDKVNVSANVDAQGIMMVSPYGIYTKPPQKEQVLLLPTADHDYVLLGCYNQGKGLSSGEVLLLSQSGAYIKLKSNGEIELNGLTITKNGTIKE